ncbi:YceI family protein [Dictyobacter arantiisoli]|uniref:Polyisoprenoid-binding protein n=1 Tax=Dictyobacter arantiisoli TaxID=2014874 RepID=A0A5A5TF44_9CHLR|nr:YceI family protein [Dictyobacter arantiisoli]GCF09693.1 polyisoprenoid-binding protein [Dictyobacter arantiisoli]
MAWTIDATHSNIGFAIRHMVVSTTRGHFTAVSGTLNIDEATPANSWVQAEADVASIDTHDANRDGHLRSADFFDAEKYPKITFKSTNVTKAGSDYKVTGDLTIRDVTKSVTFDVEYSGIIKDPYGLQRTGFTATTKISRKEFGLVWNGLLETGGAVIGDEVKLNLEFEATQQ